MAKKLNIDMKMLNLEEEQNGWNLFKIQGTPTIVHYKDGKEIDRIEGEYKKKNLRNGLIKIKNK
ncbi:thioredoxin family protein [Bacillus thuringiensis]